MRRSFKWLKRDFQRFNQDPDKIPEGPLYPCWRIEYDEFENCCICRRVGMLIHKSVYAKSHEGWWVSHIDHDHRPVTSKCKKTVDALL